MKCFLDKFLHIKTFKILDVWLMLIIRNGEEINLLAKVENVSLFGTLQGRNYGAYMI